MLSRARFAAVVACSTLIAVSGCSRDTEVENGRTDVSPAATGESNGLPTLSSPELDVQRALELFRSIGTDLDPLDIPPPLEDLSTATAKVEPNDRRSEATPMELNRIAHGSGNGTYDYFSFDVAERDQRWLIEIRGPTVSKAAYVDVGNEQHRIQPKAGDDGLFTSANLVLEPGQHWFYVYATEGGDYTARLIPLGNATAGVDREPNDDASRAMELSPGVQASATIYPETDTDYYRFSLFAEALTRLTVEPPPDLTLQVALWDATGHISKVVKWSASEPGESFEEVRRLPPGDYQVPIRGYRTSSRSPYSIRLEILDPTAAVADVEPNDSFETAAPLPTDLVLTGSLAGSADHYRLPRVTADTRLSISGDLPKTGYVYPRGDKKEYSKVSVDPETGSAVVDLASDAVGILQLSGSGRYRVALAFDPPLAAAPTPEIDVVLSMANHRFSAFLESFQETPLQAAVRNRGDEPVEVTLDLSSSHYGWRPRLSSAAFTLDRNETRVIDGSLLVSPDAWSSLAVDVNLAAAVDGRKVASGAVRVFAECDAPPVNPRPGGSLPAELEGGLNMAWSVLGGRWSTEDERERRRLASANNAYTFIDEAAFVAVEDTGAVFTVELGASVPVPVAGVLLNSLSDRPASEWIADFDLELSADGTVFEHVLSGTMIRVPIEQAFALDAPVPARFARIRVRSTHGSEAPWATLGELKVVAAPGWSPTNGAGFNLADPALGGHVVWASWQTSYKYQEAMLSEEPDDPDFKADPDLPTEWVIGFHHERAARIARLEWLDHESRHRRFERVQVAVSTESPLGPWEALGTWDLSGDPSTTRTLELEKPVWARYLKFSSSDARTAEYWSLPQTLRVWEVPTAPDYSSVIAEWGHYSSRSPFEKRESAAPSATEADDDNDSLQSADALAPGTPVAGVVTLGEDEDWYRIEIQEPSNTLDLEVSDSPRLKAQVQLFDESGQEMSWQESSRSADSARFRAFVGTDRELFVRVSEPTRAVAFSWDNSGSVGPYRSTIYQAMSRFLGEVRPELEHVNLFAFGGSLLLEDWSDQPTELQYALANYGRGDSSSSAEPALALAARELAERQGTRAVVLLTDAASPSSRDNAALWQELARSRPSIFTLHLHTASGANGGHNQDLMQDWSRVGGGHYGSFKTQGDLEVGFRRAACSIRRPARYRISARTSRTDPPGPGYLRVEMPEALGARPSHAVELILDASGSMLQRLGGKRRIDIARDVLTSLVDETIPAGTPLALRIFGHRQPKACDTALEAPLAPLDPARVAAILRSTEAKNLAKTPIGDSLRLVAQDLAGASGPKLVILLTDGEETCGGDPAAAIRELKQAGIEARLSVVGFAIEDAALKAEFESWARTGGGLYFDATDEGELTSALEAALRPKFQVLGGAGEVLAEGSAGGEAIELPAGVYQVKVLTSPATLFDAVRVEAEATATVELGE